MNIIKHTEILPFINSVEHVAHNNTTEAFEELDATALILDIIQIVNDNVPIYTTLELAITPGGYELRYDTRGYSYLDHEVLGDLERGLEVMTESLLESDYTGE